MITKRGKLLLYLVVIGILIVPIFAFGQSSTLPTPGPGESEGLPDEVTIPDLLMSTDYKPDSGGWIETEDGVYNEVYVTFERSYKISLEFKFFANYHFQRDPGNEGKKYIVYALKDYHLRDLGAKTYFLIVDPNNKAIKYLLAGKKAMEKNHAGSAAPVEGRLLNNDGRSSIPMYDIRKIAGEGSDTFIAKWAYREAKNILQGNNQNNPLTLNRSLVFPTRVQSILSDCPEKSYDELISKLDEKFDKVNSLFKDEAFHRSSSDIDQNKLQEYYQTFYRNPWDNHQNLSSFFDSTYQSFVDEYQNSSSALTNFWGATDIADVGKDQLRNCAIVTVATALKPAAAVSCLGGSLIVDATINATQKNNLEALWDLNSALFFLNAYIERMDCVANKLKDQGNLTEDEQAFVNKVEDIKQNYQNLLGITNDLTQDAAHQANSDYFNSILNTLIGWIEEFIKFLLNKMIDIFNAVPN